MRKSKSIKSCNTRKSRKATRKARKNKSIKYRKGNRKIKGGINTAVALVKESFRTKSEDEKDRDAIDAIRRGFIGNNGSKLQEQAIQDVKSYSNTLGSGKDPQTILNTAKNTNRSLWHKMMALAGK